MSAPRPELDEVPEWRQRRWAEQRRIEREEPDEWTRAMWGRIYTALYGDDDKDK